MARTKDVTTKASKAEADVRDPRAAAGPADWQALALLHHQQIRSAFARAEQAPPGGSRLAALKGLAVLLNGHSLAEEVVLYPVISGENARGGEKVYAEQSHAKVEMAMLEGLDPASEEWTAQVGAIRAAVEAHMEEEEQRWFILIKTSGVNQARLTARYLEEFQRYTRTGAIGTNAAWDAPPHRG